MRVAVERRRARALVARSLARTDTPARRSRKKGAKASGAAMDARFELGDAPHAKNATAVARFESVVWDAAPCVLISPRVTPRARMLITPKDAKNLPT